MDAAYADYWLAYPLVFAGEGDIAVSPFTNSRFPELDAEVRRDGNPAYVAPTGPAADIVENALKARGITFEKTQVASLTLFTDLSTPRRPAGAGTRLTRRGRPARVTRSGDEHRTWPERLVVGAAWHLRLEDGRRNASADLRARTP